MRSGGVLALLSCVAGCGLTRPADAGPLPDAGPPPIETTVEARDTGTIGEIDVTVPIADQRSFMVVGTTTTNAHLAVLSITDPSGASILRWEDWVEASNGLTGAFWAERTTTVINWPVRSEDPPLVPGDYVVRLGSYRMDGVTARPDVPIEVTTLTSRDADLSRGLVRVAIVWAAGMSSDVALVTATQDAVAHWRAVWAGASMDLDVRYVDSAIDPALPYPSAASGDVLLEASTLVDPGEIAMIIGETLDGGISAYGAAGQLPGPLVPSTVSAIVVSWLANAGGDGVFSPDDVQLYGEVLAHEAGHYLGLFHPVEESYDYWDSLRDTPECSGQVQCEGLLGTNLMFPYSICDGASCVSATMITRDQRSVMQLYTGTL